MVPDNLAAPIQTQTARKTTKALGAQPSSSHRASPPLNYYPRLQSKTAPNRTTYSQLVFMYDINVSMLLPKLLESNALAQSPKSKTQGKASTTANYTQ